MRCLLFFVFGFIMLNATETQKQDNNLTFAFEMGKSPLESMNFFQYSGIILILLGLLMILWIVNYRLNRTANPLAFLSNFKKQEGIHAIKLISQINLNLNTKLIIFEAYEYRYLVIVSPNHIKVIDKYAKVDFEDCLQAKSE
ncbi:MAG: hypothetical protein J1E31_06985 [Helicobacter sp.]|nr:hypothetical protein [Helicobacter sp.]